MNLLSMMRGLGRRWYIVVPGVIIAVVAAVGVWQAVKPDYVRTATQLLLPGTASIPEAGNPYLYLGGLSQAADVLVTAMSAQSVTSELVAGQDGTEISVVRDPMTSGPQLLLTVSGPDDDATGDVLAAALARSAAVLDDLQSLESITSANRIMVETITQDTESTVEQRSRIIAAGGAAIGLLLLTLGLAALVDGMSTRRRRRGRTGRGDVDPDDLLEESLWSEENPDDAVTADDVDGQTEATQSETSKNPSLDAADDDSGKGGDEPMEPRARVDEADESEIATKDRRVAPRTPKPRARRRNVRATHISEHDAVIEHPEGALDSPLTPAHRKS